MKRKKGRIASGPAFFQSARPTLFRFTGVALGAPCPDS
jgi:hypothetical protein